MAKDVLSVLGFVFLGIFGAAALLLFLPAVSKLGVRMRFDGTFTVTARLGVLRFNVTRFLARPKKKKKTKLLRFTETYGAFGELETVKTSAKAKKFFKKTSKKAKHRKTSSQKSAKGEKPSSRSVMEWIRLLTQIVSGVSVRFARYAHLQIRCLHVTAASPEAADTAVMFGNLNTAVGTLIHVCGRFRMLEIRTRQVSVYADFNAVEPTLEADMELTIRGWQLFVCALFAVRRYFFSPA